MMCAPATGWVRSSACRSWSAGGQLEHPSEVNSSARTGTPCAWRAIEARRSNAIRIPSYIGIMSHRMVLALALAAAAYGAPPPADWVPVRWPFADTASLDLLKGTPVNCLLLREPSAEFVAAAGERGLVAL